MLDCKAHHPQASRDELVKEGRKSFLEPKQRKPQEEKEKKKERKKDRALRGGGGFWGQTKKQTDKVEGNVNVAWNYRTIRGRGTVSKPGIEEERRGRGGTL